jgi:hypothetical protein
MLKDEQFGLASLSPRQAHCESENEEDEDDVERLYERW